MTLAETKKVAQGYNQMHWEHNTKCNIEEKHSKSAAKSSEKPKGNQNLKSTLNSSSSSKTQSSSSFSFASSTSTPSSGKPKNKQKQNQSKVPDLTGKLSSDGKLTPEECKCCLDQKLCLFCGNAGHQDKDCHKAASAAKAHAATATSTEASPSVNSAERESSLSLLTPALKASASLQTPPSPALYSVPLSDNSPPPSILLINTAAFLQASKLAGSWMFRIQVGAIVSASAAAIAAETMDFSNIPLEYHEFTDIFSKTQADTLALHHPYDLNQLGGRYVSSSWYCIFTLAV
ncbi:hypothetical protein BDQ17DRAFT_1426744 [Cyathus striatus]|nr:hypothetical protein BDQ17DRAFT_1426744 [Cyathus striatus]